MGNELAHQTFGSVNFQADCGRKAARKKTADAFRSAVEVGFAIRPRPARDRWAPFSPVQVKMLSRPMARPEPDSLAAHVAGGISPRRFAMILSMVRLGSTAASR
jgi:hypothetical protein